MPLEHSLQGLADTCFDVVAGGALGRQDGPLVVEKDRVGIGAADVDTEPNRHHTASRRTGSMS